MSHDRQRMRIVAEARTWLGTPWRHNMAIKGIGVDCARLPLAVAQELGLVDRGYNPGNYPTDWFKHRDEEIFITEIKKFARRITKEEAREGDIILYRVGRTASHAAIIVDKDYVIHSFREHKVVTLQERRALEDKVDSYWSIFPAES